MTAIIYRGWVHHVRHTPVKHPFRYPVYFGMFDLDDLPGLARSTRLFGYNQRRPWSLRDRDYLDGGPGSIREKLLRLLARQGLAGPFGRISLVTTPRFLGRVFNPVSFYYLHDPEGRLVACVAEVNNTFGERHVYVLPELHGDGPTTYRAAAPKAFHVSPFNNLRGDYQFRFSAPGEQLNIGVDLVREGHVVMNTSLSGVGRPWQDAELLRTWIRQPLATLLTVPRILLQAVRLRFAKKLPFFAKPVPESAMTLQVAPPSVLQKLSMRLVLPYLTRLRRGGLRLILPDGREQLYGSMDQPPQVTFRVKDYRFFVRALREGDIGFGESYMAGEWEADDLAKLLQLFIENQDVFDDREIPYSALGRFLNRATHRRRRNTVTGSRRNIADHYDLSNDFFRLFLDPSMLYSCALYREPHESLEQAQLNKLSALIRKARIGPSHHVLEIGAGWGAFAIEAVRQTGCRVTTITVSQKQLELAQERVREAGLSDRIEVRLCDYRKIEGTFDRIVSIEMLEAVGHEYLGAFFDVCDRVLAPDGLLALQVITIPDQRYDAYRTSVDWIQKHIFPGGHLPSLSSLCAAMTGHSRFVVENLDNIGVHYARTLREWRVRFLGSVDQLRAMGYGDDFIRKWEYYFAYCEAAFATRTLNNLHLVLTRPNNPTLNETR